MTIYEKVVDTMTPEKLARILVKAVVINNTEMYYMTSTGQLFPFNDLDSAIKYEYDHLMTQLEEENDGE